MPTAVAPAPPDPGSLIPAPALIRDRLARLRVELRLLVRLLRLSEDHCRVMTRGASADRKAVADAC